MVLFNNGLLFDPGVEIVGPAVIHEPAVTLAVQPGRRVSVDDFGNYHVIMTYGDDNG